MDNLSPFKNILPSDEIKPTGQWEAYRTNAGFALVTPQGKCLCWEWDIAADDLVLLLRSMNVCRDETLRSLKKPTDSFIVQELDIDYVDKGS